MSRPPHRVSQSPSSASWRRSFATPTASAWRNSTSFAAAWAAGPQLVRPALRPALSETAQQRLDILRRSDDSFEIAEKDLELRGGGDPLGLKQSGFPAYKLADPVAHRDLIAVAADDARLILARDPDLTSPRGQAVRALQELFD